MKMNRQPGKAWRLMILCLTALLGCEQTQTSVALDGTLAVFSQNPANPIFGKSSDWVRLGSGTDNLYKATSDSGMPTLEVTTSTANTAILRRVDAQLLATPFLFWSWMVSSGSPTHPVRLVIGFADAGLIDADGGVTRVFRSAEPPNFSRTLTLLWGASALQRGNLATEPSTPDGKPHASYVVRGGRENRQQWWSENLDLSLLHAQAWPDIDMDQSRIVFTGISSVGTPSPGTLHIAGFRLSR
jgi:hypothetical protein